jgi:ketosteroid isomerase-like protein
MARYARPETVVRRFVERINAHDLAGIVALLAPDHRFVDSLGAAFEGRETLRAGWAGYLRMVPDYAIELERVVADGDEVVLIGSARGTYSRDGALHPADSWRTPAAWLARVERGLLAEWRVYADNEPIRQRLREDGRQGPGAPDRG